jgi:hypothetical protein
MSLLKRVNIFIFGVLNKKKKKKKKKDSGFLQAATVNSQKEGFLSLPILGCKSAKYKPFG